MEKSSWKSRFFVWAIFGGLLAYCPIARADFLDRTNWFDSTGLMSSSPGHLLVQMTNDAFGPPVPEFRTAYFAPTNNPVTLSQPGNQLKIVWKFTPIGTATWSTETPLALAIVNTPNNVRLNADGAPPAAAYSGYAVFAGTRSVSYFRHFGVAQRADPLTASSLFAPGWPLSPGWIGIINHSYFGDPYGTVYFGNNITYTLTTTITRNASNGLEVASYATDGTSLLNSSLLVDTNPASFSFNTANIYTDGSLWGLLDTTQFDVTFLASSPAEINFQPASTSCFSGNTVTIASMGFGLNPLNYQWTFNSSNLSGQTNSSITLSNAQFSQSGTYTLVLSDNLGHTTSSNTVLTVVPPLPCVAPPSGLVSWWPADGDAFDAAGGNSGTPTPFGVTYQNGKSGGQAFRFYTSGSAVQIGEATNLHLQDFTIETWIKRSDVNIVSGNGGPGFWFSFGQGGYGFGINEDGTLRLDKIGVDGVTSSAVPADTSWHHAAVTKSGTNVSFYIDGAMASTVGYTNYFEFLTPANIGAVGGDNPYPIDSFFGLIDEMSIYNRALSAGEIQSIYNSGTGKCQQAPTLSISSSPSTVDVHWPGWAAGFNLQSSPGAAGAWTNLAPVIQTNGAELKTTLPKSPSGSFFRLSYPMP